MICASFDGTIAQFKDAIQAAGLTPPDAVDADGELHRFPSNGKAGDDAGWYLLHGDGIPAGSFGCWRAGTSQSWRADIGRGLTPAEEAEHRAKVEAMQTKRQAEEVKRKADAKAKALAIWNQATPTPEDHAYLLRKGIKAHGAKLYKDSLVIPMRADGEIHSLQFIGPDGGKRFLPGGKVKGCYFSIGNPKGAAALCIAEGFATGATIHEATGYPVAAALSAGNMGAVSKAMREKFPDLPLIVCADDDIHTDGNPGLTAATDAARAVGGLLAVPDFGPDRPHDATDFNDMMLLRGPDAVRSAIANAVSPDAGDDDNGWPEPLPLTAKLTPEPYPIDAMPDPIQAAVREVAGFVKAPVPMVAGSALAALSLAAQSHIDVRREERLEGPSGLFLLTIADSGERKSTCDGFFTKVIREYEAEQAEIAKPLIQEYRADLEAWEAKKAGIKERIRQEAKAGKPTASSEHALRDLEHEKPEAPKVPRLLYADATPEALTHGLAKDWPAGGVVSAEAGIVFGSHGMGKESVTRNLATLNQLWDGTSLDIRRKSSESFVVQGARLTVALQIQEPTLRDFFSKSGALARGTGFMARFLIAWPESTQGSRSFTAAPTSWPALSAYHRRIAAILNQPAPIDDVGGLQPAMLTFTPEARQAWIAFHDAIESSLASGGELYDVRDVASKSADNAARLAGLFHAYEHGTGGAISLETFQRASRIAAWHLSEARRFFGEIALPTELADAARLDSWLIEHCRRDRTHMVGKRHVRQHGPLRDGQRLDAAIRELAEIDHVRLVKDGKSVTIQMNPAILGFATATVATPATHSEAKHRTVATVASVAVANHREGGRDAAI